jgi:hypothetical protein
VQANGAAGSRLKWSRRRDTGPLEERQPGRDCRSGKGHFPTEDAARKLLYLAIQNAVPPMDPNPGMDESPPRVQNPIRRPPTRLTPSTTAYTLRRTPSS